LILEYIFGAAAIAIGWSGYFCNVLKSVGVVVPTVMTKAALQFPDGGGVEWSDGMGNIPAVIIIIMCTCILAVGIEESAKVNNVVVGVKISVLLLFILGGVWHINPANYEPFLPTNTGTYGEYGLSGVFRASSVMLFAYIGFDAVSTCAAEAVCPERTVPLGILGPRPTPSPRPRAANPLPHLPQARRPAGPLASSLYRSGAVGVGRV
jgi:APA family basic amino acid/polyamine antiporter